MNVRKLVTTNAVNAGVSSEVAVQLATKFERYHREKKIVDSDVRPYKIGAKKSPAELKADASKKEAADFITAKNIQEQVAVAAKSLKVPPKKTGLVAGIWTGAAALAAAGGYFFVNVLKTVAEKFNNHLLSAPMDDQIKFWVGLGVGLGALAAATFSHLRINKGKDKVVDVGFELEAVNTAATKNGKQ